MNFRYRKERIQAENIFLVEFTEEMLNHIDEIKKRLNEIDSNRKLVFVNTIDNSIDNTVETEKCKHPHNYKALCAGIIVRLRGKSITWISDNI